MKATASIDQWKNVFYALDKIVNDAELIVSDKGLVVQEPDPSNTAVIRVDLPTEFFEEWDAQLKEDEEKRRIGVHIPDLYSLVKSASGESLTISTSEDEVFVSYGSSKFTLPIMNFKDREETRELRERDFEEMSYPTECVVNSESLADALDTLLIVGEPITFELQDEVLKLEASSDSSTHSGSTEVDVWDTSDEESETMMSEDLMSDFVSIVSKTFPSDENINLEFGGEKPLMIDAEFDKISYTFVIAPRIPER